MKPFESTGWIARVIGGIQNSIKNRPTRLRKSLISTADELVKWIGKGREKPVKKNGTAYSDLYIIKKVSHYRRQYKANRKKLK